MRMRFLYSLLIVNVGILIMVSLIPCINLIHETFINSKMPVSGFTIDYISKMASATDANKYFTQIQGENKRVKLPKPVTGTLLDQPKTYSSYWFNL